MLRQGTISENHLEKIIEKSRKNYDKSVTLGPGIGNDYAQVQGIVVTDGVGETPEAAWYKAWGNFTCSLGNCLGARVTYFLPKNGKQSEVVNYAESLQGLATDFGVSILGGHTEVTEEVQKAQFQVTLIGTAQSFLPQKKRVSPGDDIIMIGFAGLFGSRSLLQEHLVALRERFPGNFLEQDVQLRNFDYVKRLTEYLCLDGRNLPDVCYLHDISCGGVYGALWQMGCCVDRGLLVENKMIPIKQSTVEMCEFEDCNPYLLDGTGAFLLLSKQGRTLASSLEAGGIPAKVIGKITEGKERLVRLGPQDIRTLGPVNGDERKNKN